MAAYNLTGSSTIQVELPVQAPFLATDGNPDTPIPAGGVPFDMSNHGAYLAAIRQKLDASTAGVFTPTIDQLDALIESLLIKGL